MVLGLMRGSMGSLSWGCKTKEALSMNYYGRVACDCKTVDCPNTAELNQAASSIVRKLHHKSLSAGQLPVSK